MNRAVELPLWLLVLILAFAAVTAATHLLIPSVRWFLRRRAEKLVARLNDRLARPIEPFRLARRTDLIARLSYDPVVAEAIALEAAETGDREDVAFERVQRYAREIVPAFSAFLYFNVATRVAKALSWFLYDVRPGRAGLAELAKIDPKATVVFVMNHRSNMDYVLVTWLSRRSGALSYAVGEWARVWPLQPLIRGMGGYFIRRRSRGALYRTVLARYVTLATKGGLTQAVFPEGGLSVTGGLQPPRLGILDYVVRAGVPVVFVPVAINYDRVLEDRILTEAGREGERRFRAAPLDIGRFVGRYLALRLARRRGRFGTAAVRFGRPLDLAPGMDAETLGRVLMERIAAAVPVLAAPLVATAALRRPGAGRESWLTEADRLSDALREAGANVVPGAVRPERLAKALDVMERRGLVAAPAGGASSVREPDIVRFYAASIAHLVPAGWDGGEGDGPVPDAARAGPPAAEAAPSERASVANRTTCHGVVAGLP